MKPYYPKTQGEIDRDEARKWNRVQNLIIVWFFIILSALLFGKLATYSIQVEAEKIELQKELTKCENRKPWEQSDESNDTKINEG